MCKVKGMELHSNILVLKSETIPASLAKMVSQKRKQDLSRTMIHAQAPTKAL